MKKVLLLNPPGEQLYVRDYYCSKVSKASYIYHPTDLLVASGWLNPHFELTVLDCIAEGLDPNSARKRVAEIDPEAIFFLTGSVSRKQDFQFMNEIKQDQECLLVGSGDCLLDEFDTLVKDNLWLDAIVLDFMSESLTNYLRNKLYGENLRYQEIIDLSDGVDVSCCSSKRLNGVEFNMPVPRYELFPNHKYRYPFVRTRPFATILTDYGCPYRCKFCVMAEIGFKRRPVANILEELDHVHQLGFRSIYFVDQTFGCNKTRLKELCAMMISRNYKFRWVAFTRADVMDREVLGLMKQAGCDMLMFGVESPVQRVLDSMNKDIRLYEIEECFNLCKELGIRTLATFIVGLPGTTYEENIDIGRYAVKIGATYGSFNTLVPRVNTEIRKDAMQVNQLVSEADEMDQSGGYGILPSELLSVADIKKIHRTITIKFYSRPSYILSRIFAIRTWYEVLSVFTNGIAIFRKVLNN